MASIPRILIVDDDSNIAELISLYLTKEMFDTRTAGDGYQALEFKEGSETVLEGQGWITITAENVDSFGF